MIRVIKLHPVLGTYAITPLQGQSVLFLASEALQKHDQVVLDFEGVNAFSAAFWSYAVAHLLYCHEAEDLNRRLRLEGIPSHARKVLRACIENVRQKFSQ